VITLSIGSETRTLSDDLSDVDEAWVNRGINQPSTPPCVRLRIQVGHLNMSLTSGNCPGGAGGGRAPSPDEARVSSLWHELRLNSVDFSGGHLIAFLKRARRMW
jgi:hypothetical protein